MKEPKPYYLVYRIFKRNNPDGHVSYLYGWTRSKTIARAFLEQRDPAKYLIHELDKYDIGKVFSDTYPHPSSMIDILPLKSACTGDEFHLFITENEMMEAEGRIQKMFEELCSVNSIANLKGAKDPIYYLELIRNIIPFYGDALEAIGFQPPEWDDLYADPMYREDPCALIEMAYAASSSRDPKEQYHGIGKQPHGVSVLTPPCKKIFYSIESFVSVLKDDM